MNGTSIHDLHKQEKMNQYQDIQRIHQMKDAQYGTMENLQYEQGHNAAHVIHQAQHAPYYEIDTPIKYPQFTQQPPVPTPPVEQDIENLANDISNNLSSVTNVSENFEEDKGYKFKFLSGIPKFLIDPILIVILFVILSQTFIRNTLSKYIKQLVPSKETGYVGMTGIIIYGIILAVVYSLTKKFLVG